MSGEDQDLENQDSALGMSDEDFLNLPPDAFEPDETDGLEVVVDTADADDNPDPDGDEDDSGYEEDADESDDTDADEEDPDADADSDDGDDAGDTGGSSDDDADDDDDSGDTDDVGDEGEEDDDADVDYQAAYNELLAPFRANGRDIKVDNVEDARRLMQMGANYNKKMQGLKPSLKILKTLENNEISEDKLNFLIDLDKKDPAAIARLVKEAGIDPLDFDLGQSDGYTAGNHAADEAEVAVEEVLGEIKDSKHYNDTLELVGTKWDNASKQIVRTQPELLKVINDHMASGVYDLISTEVERQQMLGQLAGMSDLEAYRTIGDAIQARGGFDHLFQSQEQGQQNGPPKDSPAPKKRETEQKRRNRRRAASTTKSAPRSKDNAGDFNPLAMSDEEFEAQFDSTLM